MDTILWAVPFLLATCLLNSPADACSCAPAHPQQAFCTSDLAFRARVLSRNLEDIPETHLYATPLQIARYDLEDVKIIKGADKVSSLKHVYSPPSDFMCGVELMEDTEYLLTGRLNGDKVHIGLCDLVRPWVELIPSQQQNVLKYYQLGCSCRIMTCFSLPCSVFADDECLWTDLVQNEHRDGYQARNFACLPQPHLPTLCSWHHGMAPALDEAEDDYDYEEERPEPLLARARPDFYPPGTKYNRLVI